MSAQYPGGFITKSPPTPSGAYDTSSGYGIWNLAQQAGYQKQGLWPTAGNQQPDAQFNYVTMLLHGDGTNGAQNNTFLDSSGNSNTITRYGNTTQGSFGPYGSNWSTYFPNGSYQTVGGQDFGTGNFTVEFWVYIAEAVDSEPVVFGGEGTGSGMMGAILNTGSVRIGVTATSWDITSPTGVVSMFAWNHIAIVRSGTGANQTKIYVNGTSVVTGTFSLNCTDTAFDIQRRQASVLADSAYFSNLRITKNAVYSGNFTPSTTPLTAISGTSLLMCQSNRFIDNSGNNYTINKSGTPSIQRFNPFGTSTAYSTATIGGSAYFDGTGDYLTTPTAALDIRTNSFTFEAWIYPLAAVSFGLASSDASNNFYMQFQGGDNFYLGDGSINNIGPINSATSGLRLNAWNYVAVTFDGTTYRFYMNGSLISSSTTLLKTTAITTLRVGAYDYTTTTSNMYMSGFRYIKGTAQYTGSTMTIPTSPVSAVANTATLLQFTNGAIYDNAMMNDLETVGNAQISTSVKKYGTGSVYFDGTGDWLSAPSSPQLNMGASSFTIEGWFYPSGNVTAGKGLFGKRTDNSTIGGILFYFSSTGLTPRLLADIGGAWGVDVTASSGFTDAQWNHFAVVRNGSTWTIYINGTSVGSTTNSGTVRDNTAAFTWMAESAAASEGTTAGYLDDLRITKGYARYTTTFTPPTAAFPNTGPN